LAKGAIDPVYPTAYLDTEEVERLKEDPTDGQLDSLFVKVTRVYQTLPGPAISSRKINDRGDLETSIKQMVVSGTSPDADGLLVTTTQVEQEDTSKGVKTTATVGSHSTLSIRKLGNIDLIPAKFRANQTTSTSENIVAPTAALDSLTGGVVESQVAQTSKTKAKKSTVSLTGATTSLTSKKLTDNSQVATVTETLIDTGGSDDSLTGSATIVEASIDALGNGKSVKSVATVDSVFGEQTYSSERPDVLPQKFRVAIPTLATSSVEAGTAAAPTLATGELSKTEEQVTAFKKRKRASVRASASGAILTGKKVTAQGQVATVTESYDPNGTQTITATATIIEGGIEALGDGSTVKTVVDTESVFGENSFSLEVPDVLPQKFRVAIPAVTTSSVVAGTAATPTLSTGDLSKSEEQVTVFKKRTKKTTRSAASNKTLTGSKVTSQGQIATVTETYSSGSQTITGSATVIEGGVETIGDGSTVKTIVDTGSVFGEQVFSLEVPDVLPQKFRVAIPAVTTSLVAAGTAAAPTLATGDLSKLEEQVTPYKKRTRSTSRSAASGKTLIGSKLTDRGQVATVTETYSTSGQTINASATTIDGQVETIGDGGTVLTVSTVGSVFSEQAYSSEKPTWGIPMKLKLANPVVKETHVTTGTVAEADVTLAANEMERSSEQVTAFKKKVSVSKMGSTTTSLAGTQTGTWGVETVTESFDPAVPSVTGAYGIKEDAVEPIGDGRSQRKKITYPTSPASLTEIHTDETYRIKVTMVKTLVNSTSVPPTPSANQTVERTAIDAWHSIQILSTADTAALPSAETWEHTYNYSFPDKLQEVGVIYEKTEGAVGATGNVIAGALGTSDSWRAEASARATAMVRGVPYTTIIKGYSGPCKASTTRTFSATPPTGITAPTLIKPVFGTVIITGTGETRNSESAISGVGNHATHSSGGAGIQSDVIATRHTFGPVVHDNPSLQTSGDTTAQATDSSSAGSVPGGGGYPTAYAEANASLNAVLKLPASSTPVAAGGSIIADVKVEKWRFGIWIKEVTTVYHP